MPLSKSLQRDLQHLIDDKIDDDISELDFQKLTNWLDESEEARDFYVDYVGLHAGLNWEFSDVDAESIAPVEPVRTFSWIPIVAVAAAILLAGLWFVRNQPSKTREPVSSAVVAEVIDEKQADWSLKSDFPQSGNWLPSGELDLRSGQLTVRLNSGVRLDLIGPCRMDLDASKPLYLENGTLIAHVPAPARGFTVTTPHGRIVDLGTVFAATVSAGGGTTVHVNRGLVTLSAGDGSDIATLKTGEAAQRLTPAGSTDSIQYDKRIFGVMSAGSSSPPANYAHWGFDQRNQNEILDLGNLVSGPFPATLKTKRIGREGAWPESPFGRGFSFNGSGETLESRLPGIAGSGPRTVALWVKVPADISPKNSYALVGWGASTFGTKGKKWLLTLNRNKEDGNEGCFRTEFGGGFVVGSTDLRDGKWHHLASVWQPGETDDLSQGLRLYVDGKLESVSGSSPENVDTQIAGPKTHMIRMGTNLPTSEKEAPGYFRGALDEIFIINRGLSQKEIKKLMDTNAL